MSIRAVKRMVQSQATMEGAGVRLQRAFGFGDTSDFDPFLLLDDFRNEKPEDYLAGFPWHPHRGIETITYVLAGTVEHGDSLGNRGTLGGGDVQWMTAGSGILHQEMPKGEPRGRMHGFQLWANLPSSLKMTSPRYQDVQARNIPEVVDDDGTRIRVICGLFWGRLGRSTVSRQTPGISTCRCRLAPPGGSRSSIPATPSPMCSPVPANSATRRHRRPSQPSRLATPRRQAQRRQKTGRSCFSTAATRSSCRPATRASAFSWSLACRSGNQWPGMARS